MINLKEVSCRFGSFTALDNISLDIPKGQLFAYLGPNGAGKTTTIRMLVGSLAPTSGSIHVAGLPMPASLNAVKARFGYVPDLDNHIEEFSGRQNLKFYARLYGADHSRIDEALSLLELSEAADLGVGTYSRGMKKKLMIAREILHQPEVIYFDEPTANLDAHSTEVVRGLLKELAAQGTTIFLTTHNMKEVEQICDRVAIISRGRMIAEDTPSGFISSHARRLVDVHYDADGGTTRLVLNMDSDEERARLAELVRDNPSIRIHSRAFDFEDAFLRLTGESYQ